MRSVFTRKVQFLKILSVKDLKFSLKKKSNTSFKTKGKGKKGKV